MHSSHLTKTEQQQIMVQQNKLGGITMPTNFTSNAKNQAQGIVEDSFVDGFRWSIGINALFAFISAVISFFTINYTKKAKQIKQ
jgi:hypothetical protein